MPDNVTPAKSEAEIAEDAFAETFSLGGDFGDPRQTAEAATPDESSADKTQEPVSTSVATEEPNEPAKDDNSGKPADTGETPPAETTPLTPEQVTERIKQLLKTDTPEQAIKRVEAQNSMVGKQAEEVGAVRKENQALREQMAAVNAKLEVLTSMASGKTPDDVAKFITDPNANKPAETTAMTPEQYRQIAREEAERTRESDRQEQAAIAAQASHDARMRETYGPAWDQFKDARERMAESTAQSVLDASEGKIAPPEVWFMAAIGKQYLADLKSGKVPGTTTAPQPTGGVGGASSSGEGQEAKPATMEDAAEAEFELLRNAKMF